MRIVVQYTVCGHGVVRFANVAHGELAMIGFLTAVTILAIIGGGVVFLNEKSHREDRLRSPQKDKLARHP